MKGLKADNAATGVVAIVGKWGIDSSSLVANNVRMNNNLIKARVIVVPIQV
jgi:hypothetical protein